MSWEELAELSARFAAELERREIRCGDRVLIWGENSAEWIAAFFGCMLRGVVAVPLDAAGGTDFARRVISEVQPRLMTGSPELISELGSDGASVSAPFLSFAEFSSVLPPPNYEPIAGISADTVLQIVFTSGTTAEPKGIVHTHGNVLASLDPVEEEVGKYRGYERVFHPVRFLHTLPLSHVFGQFMGLWVPPLIAAEVHYESRLEAGRLVRAIHQNRISVLAAVPRMLDLLRAHLIAEDPELPGRLVAASAFSFWHRWWHARRLHRRLGLKFLAVVCGGAALPAELERFWSAAGFALIQGYGMTETTALVTLNHPFKIAQGSIGRPLRGREVEIGPQGEILVRGAAVADRIWRHGQMEQRPPGWLATGDLVTRNAQGDLLFAGRKSDIIVTSAGLNIHPQDLEAALRKEPGIRDVLVVPYASPSGPAPAAALILRGASSPPDAAAAVEGANRKLAEFQQILYWVVWPQPDFPRTTTGKARRKQVEQWVEKSLGDSSGTAPSGESSTGLEDPLIELLHRAANSRRPIAEDDRLAEDLHLDSLAMVQLQSELETRFGVEINDAAWQQVQTVAELRSLLRPTSGETSAGESPSPVASSVTDSSASVSAIPGSVIPSSGTSGSATEGSDQSRRQPAAAAPPRRAQVYPRWPWWTPVRLMRVAFLECVVRPLVGFLVAPEVGPRIHPKGPGLLVANHVSTFDGPILLYALRARDRDRLAVAMSGEMLLGWRSRKAQTHRLVSWLAPLAYWLLTALFNVFPLPRGGGLRQSFAHAGEALDRGYHVLVFPEGSRSADGRLRPFESGIGLLARDSQVPVWPIYIAGLGPLKLRQKSWFRSGTVAVRFGQPLEVQAGEDPADFARRLQAALEALAQTSVPAVIPGDAPDRLL